MSPPLAAPLSDGTAATGRTDFRLALPTAMLNLPVVTALVTVPADSRHAKGAPFDLQGGSLHQGLSDFAPRFRHNPLEGRTGNAHLVSGIFLVTPFQVGQAQCFQLFVEQSHTIQ
jgi:hypothetical protein